MRTRILRTLLVALLSITLLAPSAFAAASEVATAPGGGSSSPEVSEELPLYLQLMMYVVELLNAGEEVPKALINKIQTRAKHGK